MELSILKVNYSYLSPHLEFKSFDGCVFTKDFELYITESESLNLIDKLRELIRGEISSHMVTYLDKELHCSYDKGILEIVVFERSGEKVRPLGGYKYDRYSGGDTLLDGLRKESIKIRDNM